ncbi:hypothetical protein JQ615_34505 [Bradyrhizobium jicamae]|uniref:Uncharacterized protein n=1 Tax=Bradyrhizobium jicamae TaxID=280332 RepID=A0ABS5FW56_9BRAD|nr:hypothetical protein [Bradyrhizobium jicamae]MBR0800491.1 hypothetical protein [Bradyrhizobium jicamae]
MVTHDQKSTATLSGSMGIFSGADFYWIQAKNLSVDGKEYLVLGSPQTATWLIIRDNGYKLVL